MTRGRDEETLVRLFAEREEHDPLSQRYGYLTGRIDEFCAQRGFDPVERERLLLRGVRLFHRRAAA